MPRQLPIILLFITLVSSCRPSSETEKPVDQAAAMFGSRLYTDQSYASNPKAVALGREIFNEKMLSVDSTVSCASCHLEGEATVLAQPGVAFSAGVQGKHSLRNTPALVNLAWIRPFFRDGGVADLDLVALAAISNENEMNLNTAEAMGRVINNPYYQVRFKEVYGKDPSSLLILKSLSAYMLQFQSTDTKYDKAKRGELSLSESELKGEQVFINHCNSCHKLPLTTNNGFANNGLPAGGSAEKGLMTISNNASDYFKFKVPQLREVGKTSPYMYDGRFTTLEQVVEHYSSGMYNYPNIAPEFQNIAANGGFKFSTADKNYLVAFLRTFETASANTGQ